MALKSARATFGASTASNVAASTISLKNFELISASPENQQ
jgi:hypothetical protein